MSTMIEPAFSAPARNPLVSKGISGGHSPCGDRHCLRTLVLRMSFPKVGLVAVIGNVKYFLASERALFHRNCMQHSNRKFFERRKLSVLSLIC